MEQNYEFRKRLRQVHRSSRVNPDLSPRTDECAVDQNWTIVLHDDFAADKTVRTAMLENNSK